MDSSRLARLLRWIFDSLEVLDGFIEQAVVNRRDNGFVSGLIGFGRIWDLGLMLGLRPDFVPPSPVLVIKDPQTQSSQILVEPQLIDAEFRKPWMPFICRSGHLVVAVDQFLVFVGHLLPQEPQFDLPRIYGAGFAGGCKG